MSASPFGTDPHAYALNWPGDAVFAPGCVSRLGRLLQERGVRHALVVTDRGIVESGLLQRVLGQPGVRATVHADVNVNPSLADAEAALQAWWACGADALVALGGGSAIDTAKLMVARLCSDVTPEQLFAEGDAAITRPVPLFIAIPTTAGTGSESTLAAVVKDAQGRKRVIRSAKTRPQLVLLDPELTLSVPPSVTAATGFDVVMHALGAATNRAHNPVGLALAQQAFVLAAQALPRVLDQPQSLQARSDMLQASHLAGVAIGLKGVDAIHGLCTPLESVAQAPHAHVLAVVMAPVLRVTARRVTQPYAQLARGCGWGDDAFALVDGLIALRERCALPQRLGDIGVHADDLPSLVDAAAEGPSTRLHALAFSRDDVLALYHSML